MTFIQKVSPLVTIPVQTLDCLIDSKIVLCQIQ
jgi:hypothetical protein